MIFTLSLLDPLYIAFSWVMRGLYDFFNNYAVVVIVFTIIIRALLIPLSVKQHKTQLRTQSLAPQIDDLKRVYGKDRQGLQQAQMELYKQHNISQAGGCLPSLLSILVIWPVYRLVSAPLHWIAGVGREQIASIAQYLAGMGAISPSQVKALETVDIPVLQGLTKHSDALVHSVRQGWLQMKDLLDLNFLGINLGETPSLNPKLLFGEQSNIYLPLLVITLLAVITTFLSTKVMEWTSPNHKKLKEERELAKKNPARTEPTDMTQQGMMKGMKYTMPIFTLFISLSMPAAMGLYWVVSNLMSIVQQYILYFLYTKHSHRTL